MIYNPGQNTPLTFNPSNFPFQVAYPRNIASHPILGEVFNGADGYPGMLDSPVRVNIGHEYISEGHALYVKDGIGRLQVGRHVTEVIPGTVLTVKKGAKYKFLQTGQALDVRRCRLDKIRRN